MTTPDLNDLHARVARLERRDRLRRGVALAGAGLAVAVLVPAAMFAGSVTLPNAFSNGTLASATDVNANFAALAQAVNDNHARLAALEKTGRVVQVQTVQTRVQGSYAAPISGDGTEITPLTLTITPAKAGNKMLLEWVVNGEIHHDTTFVVSRNGVRLADASNAGNSRWAGVATPVYDNNYDSTPFNTVVRIIDTNSLATATTYELRIRSASAAAQTLTLNRTLANTGADAYETGLSVGTATELWQ